MPRSVETTQPKILSGKNLQLPGAIRKYGLNANGLLYALLVSQKTGKRRVHWLAGLSLDRGLLWQLTDLPAQPTELRIAPDGNAYVSTTDAIVEVTPTGQVDRFIAIPKAAHQEIGSFVLLDDGLLISIQGKEEPHAAVIRTDREGQIIWTTNIPPGAIAYQGVVTMARENNWEPRPSAAWTPQNWLCLSSNEILVSGQHALVSFHEMPRSGIGRSYQLDLATGAIRWVTDPAPYQSVCLAADGRWLIGYQGYGAFETKLYDTDGTVVGHWPSVGEAVVSADRRLLLVEMDNGKSKLHYTELLPDNQIKRGPSIPGYYIISPAIDEFGTMVFFRDSRLYLIGPDHSGSSLSIGKAPTERFLYGGLPERILLRDGLIVFSWADTLYLFESNLGRLAASPWPCKYGNLERNPVISA